MTGLWTVTRRELAEWRPVAWMTLALLAMVWCLPWIPGLPKNDPALLRSMGATLVAALFGIGLALLLGANLVGRDLAEGRFGFYLSLPLSAAQIWFGKLLAAALLLTGSLGLLQLPLLFEPAWLVPVTGHGPSLARSVPLFALTALVLLLLLVLLAHALGVGVRSHSPVLVVDAAGWVGTTALLISAYLTYTRYYGYNQLVRGLGWWLLLVLTAWLIAGWLQIRQGGSSLTHGHRWLATVGWGVTLLTALGLAAHARWTHGGGLEEVTEYHAAKPAPAGPWLAVVGETPRRDMSSSYLVNVETGQSTVATRLNFFTDPIAFSTSGDRAYAVRRDRRHPPHLVAWELGESARELPVPLPAFDRQPELAAADGWLAIWSDSSVELYRVEPWSLVGKTEPPGYGPSWNVLPGGEVRAFGRPVGRDGLGWVWRFDGARATKETFGEGLGKIEWLHVEADGRAARFIAGGALYRYDPELDPAPVRFGDDIATSTSLRVAELNGVEILARRQGESTQLTIPGRDTEETSVPGRPASLKALADQSHAVLAVWHEGSTRFHRIRLDAEGRLQVEEIATHPERLFHEGRGVYGSQKQIVRLDSTTGVLYAILP